MAVTFVPPRTRIRGSDPIVSAPTAPAYTADGDASDGDELYDDIEMGGLDEHGGGSLLTKKLVVPGQLVTDDAQFMRGHGTYVGEEDKVIASVAGTVQRVNKLLSVKPLTARYSHPLPNSAMNRKLAI
jgi:exosome complex component RRP4